MTPLMILKIKNNYKNYYTSRYYIYTKDCTCNRDKTTTTFRLENALFKKENKYDNTIMITGKKVWMMVVHSFTRLVLYCQNCGDTR